MPRPRRFGLALLALTLTAVGLWAQDLPVIRPATRRPAPAKPADTKAEVKEEEHWQVVMIGAERIGYVRSRTAPLPAEAGQPDRSEQRRGGKE
jgi:hypothetical protein